MPLACHLRCWRSLAAFSSMPHAYNAYKPYAVGGFGFAHASSSYKPYSLYVAPLYKTYYLGVSVCFPLCPTRQPSKSPHTISIPKKPGQVPGVHGGHNVENSELQSDRILGSLAEDALGKSCW